MAVNEVFAKAAKRAIMKGGNPPKKAFMQGGNPPIKKLGGIPGRGNNGPIRHQPTTLGPAGGVKRVEPTRANPVRTNNATPVGSTNSPTSNAGDGEAAGMSPVLGSTNISVGKPPRGNPLPDRNAKRGGTKLEPGRNAPPQWKNAGVNPPKNNKPDIASAAARRIAK